MRCSAAVAAAAELEQQRSRERKKTTERGRMKKDLKVVLIYKEKTDREGARNEEARHGYPATPTPRFSGWSLR